MRGHPMDLDGVPGRLAAGAAAGVVGTFALQGLLAGSGRWAPGTLPPIRQDPAEYMVGKAKELLLPLRRARFGEAAVEKGLQLGYGTTFGVLYGLAGGELRNPLVTGALLGLAAWATGYLGWLPATGLMPPVTRQAPARVAGPIVTHALFGITTAAAFGWLSRRFGR